MKALHHLLTPMCFLSSVEDKMTFFTNFYTALLYTVKGYHGLSSSEKEVPESIIMQYIPGLLKPYNRIVSEIEEHSVKKILALETCSPFTFIVWKRTAWTFYYK